MVMSIRAAFSRSRLEAVRRSHVPIRATQRGPQGLRHEAEDGVIGPHVLAHEREQLPAEHG